MIAFSNVEVFCGGLLLPHQTVVVEADRFTTVATDTLALPEATPVIDGTGLILGPGLIDLQVNGGFGDDFTAAPETIWNVAAQLPRFGVTRFLPTIISSPPETVAVAQAVIQAGPPKGFRGALPLGLHLEGPFFNPEKRGAHNPNHLRQPDPALIETWSPAEGVRLVTLAPELTGAVTLIETLVARNVVVSAGHSQATFDEAQAGFAAGIRYGTHLFNAMPPLHHRKPGLAAALLSDKRLTIGLIADGIHVHPAMVKLAWQLAGSRLNLVTDAMTALGMPPGAYVLGDQTVQVTETDARLADGTLAGSVLSLDQALRNLMTFAGVNLAQVLPLVTERPASLLGQADTLGRVAQGAQADLVLLDPAHQVVLTMVAGQIVYHRDDIVVPWEEANAN